MNFFIKSFSNLTRDELYDILQLRAEVFVIEQNCIYQDIDRKDQKAWHVLGYKNNFLIAYSRIFDAGDYFYLPSIGRIIVKKNERRYKYGSSLVDTSIQFILQNFKEKKIQISAQKYLVKFYNFHGFIQQGEEYLEDGLPHVRMIRIPEL